MATTIINPTPNNNSNNNGIGFFLGALVLVVLAIMFYVYALPYIKNFGGGGGIQVNVPKNIDVKVQQTK